MVIIIFNSFLFSILLKSLYSTYANRSFVVMEYFLYDFYVVMNIKDFIIIIIILVGIMGIWGIIIIIMGMIKLG